MVIGNVSPRKLEPLCGKIGRDNVERVVHAFYDNLRNHPELKLFFVDIPDFESHEAHIADFWWVAMGGRIGDHRPFDMAGRHMPLGLTENAFALWLDLFHETLLGHLPAELAEQWFQMALGIGANLRRILLGKA